MATKRKRTSIWLFIIPVFLIAVVAIVTILYNNSKKVLFTNSNVAGNTAGNLYNGGLFCEYNDKIYFSNAYDNGYIYVMDVNGTNLKCLSENTAGSINVDGNYIYYCKNNLNENTKGALFRGSLFGIHRININGKNSTTLSDEVCTVATVANNTVYYLHYDDKNNQTLRSISIDGTNDTLVTKEPINPSCIVDGKMYYNDVTTDLYAYSMNLGSSAGSVLYGHKCWNLIYSGNYIYFMDVEDNYKLARVNLSSGEKETLTDERIDLYNIYGDIIFYQTNGSDSALCRMNADGSNKEQIVSGNFTNVNMTSNYVYFNQYGHDTPVYKVSRTGDTTVSSFTEAAEAVETKKKTK